MQIKQDEFLYRQVIAILDKLNNKDRSEGIHFSSLNSCLRKHFYAQKHPSLEKENLDHTTLLFAMGLAFESYITGGKKQKEYCIDNIYLTPDFVLEDGEAWEIKTSYFSSNKDISENEQYIRQIKAYCKAVGVLEFGLVVLYYLGDWSWVWKRKGKEVNNRKPIMNTYKFTFTEDEINENWQTAKLKRDWLIQAIRSGVPPLPIKLDYECKFCKWGSQGICDQVKVKPKELF